MNYITCYGDGYEYIGPYTAPFDIEVDCYYVCVIGEDFSEMKLRGKCKLLSFANVVDYRTVDISGFMELEINSLDFGSNDKGLLKLLELKCEKICCEDKKLENIVNKYLQEEPDPLMRDIQGCKYELAVNGFGDRI